MATQEIGVDGFPKSDWQMPQETLDAMKTAGVGPGSTPASPAPAFQAAPAAAPKPAPTVVDLSGRPLTRTFDLAWPKSVDGVEIRRVVAHRISTAEMSAFVDRVRAATDGDSLPYPIFRRVDGAPLTAAEWAALDADDTDTLVEDAEAFLPGRFKVRRAPAASSPAEPATSGSSSDGSQASASAN